MAKRTEPSLFGPAERPAAAAEGLVVHEVESRSILNECGIDDYSFNCYTGCQHGCVYCYARFMQRFHPHEEAWGEFVDVKVNAPAIMAKQVRRFTAGTVFTCSACDGWQAIEKHYELTQQCCKLLLDAGFSLRVLTKSELVLRDLDLFRGRDVTLGVTITTTDERIAAMWEPRASSVEARKRILREAKAAGLRTTVMFGPLLPGFSDSPEEIRKLFSLAADADVDHIWADAMNPRPRVWPAVQEMLRRRRPDLVEHYRCVLFDPEGRREYVAELNKRIRAAAREARMSDRLS